jgi:hypothetical protein
VASRTEQKAKARAEREAREREAAVAESRKRRLRLLGAAAAALAVVAIVVVAIAASGGGDKSGGANTTGGLYTGPPPWAPLTNGLAGRSEQLGLPGVGSETYHIHAVLRVFDNGKPVEVPQGIGIDPASNFFASLHTHDATGVMHMETDNPFPFTLGQFFTIWGVKLSKTELGGLKATGQNKVQTFVNGKPIADPVTYEPKSHDKIVVAYGKPGSAPKTFQYSFPSGE